MFPFHFLESELKRNFGYATFRGPQRAAIDSLLNKSRDTFVLAPTGGGKSLCFQLPALLKPGLAGTLLFIYFILLWIENLIVFTFLRDMSAGTR
jgi:superfamily II DNA helicase RecQ